MARLPWRTDWPCTVRYTAALVAPAFAAGLLLWLTAAGCCNPSCPAAVSVGPLLPGCAAHLDVLGVDRGLLRHKVHAALALLLLYSAAGAHSSSGSRVVQVRRHDDARPQVGPQQQGLLVLSHQSVPCQRVPAGAVGPLQLLSTWQAQAVDCLWWCCCVWSTATLHPCLGMYPPAAGGGSPLLLRAPPPWVLCTSFGSAKCWHIHCTIAAANQRRWHVADDRTAAPSNCSNCCYSRPLCLWAALSPRQSVFIILQCCCQ